MPPARVAGPLGAPPTPPTLSADELARGLAHLFRTRRTNRRGQRGGHGSGSGGGMSAPRPPTEKSITSAPVIEQTAKSQDIQQRAVATAKATGKIQRQEKARDEQAKEKKDEQDRKQLAKQAASNIRRMARGRNTRTVPPPTGALTPEQENAPTQPLPSQAPLGTAGQPGNLMRPPFGGFGGPNAPANPKEPQTTPLGRFFGEGRHKPTSTYVEPLGPAGIRRKRIEKKPPEAPAPVPAEPSEAPNPIDAPATAEESRFSKAAGLTPSSAAQREAQAREQAIRRAHADPAYQQELIERLGKTIQERREAKEKGA